MHLFKHKLINKYLESMIYHMNHKKIGGKIHKKMLHICIFIFSGMPINISRRIQCKNSQMSQKMSLKEFQPSITASEQGPLLTGFISSNFETIRFGLRRAEYPKTIQ